VQRVKTAGIRQKLGTGENAGTTTPPKERNPKKKNRQDPAPPTRSKAGRLGIAKEFIDLLLEHDVSSLRSSTHASYG